MDNWKYAMQEFLCMVMPHLSGTYIFSNFNLDSAVYLHINKYLMNNWWI